MAFDGIVLSNIVKELQGALIGGRIDKIQQPEKDEIVLSVRNQRAAYKVLLSANSSYPRIHLLSQPKPNPLAPPMFCMLLRKHLSSGKIIAVKQPHFERIVELHIEATNELGDKENKKLIIEMMGRHSNVILTKENDTILDSIKHISAEKSSVRQVLPNRVYVAPPTQGKEDPLTATATSISNKLQTTTTPIYKSIYLSYSGISPLVANQLCANAAIPSELLFSQLTSNQVDALTQSFLAYFEQLKQGNYAPTMYTDQAENPVDFHSTQLSLLNEYIQTPFESVSRLIESFYTERSTRFVVSQKTADIRKLLLTFIDRNVRKKAIQEAAVEESNHSNLHKTYGELLTAYSHQIPQGASSFSTMNYYEEPYDTIEIPLDPTLSAIANAQKYFKKYQKAKRTIIAAEEQLTIIAEDLDYLNSVLHALDLLENEQDIYELREELMQMGYLKKRKRGKQKQPKNTAPYMQFQSSAGFTIYVGKNNYQNDQLTMKFAKPNDLWLHIKDGAGSHVIIKVPHDTPVDDVTLIEAAMLAAYHSKGKHGSNVAIDYTARKNVKKIPNAKPGMVIYTNFKTIYVTPDESFIKKLAVE